MNETATVKMCETCEKNPRVKGERFCRYCRVRMLAAMRNSGYLETRPDTLPSPRQFFAGVGK